ncbi:MAG: protein containing Coagulation factor 5/8 type [Verrucomicrobiaceae bacterium]|nr:MAG: protein containing Coagulation factor 5/8 type [Verrucomicrobiaceae bacterium]
MLLLAGSFVMTSLSAAAESDTLKQEGRKNHHAPYPAVVRPTAGISWPNGQALPTFSAPAATLDTVFVQSLSLDEQITFSALQGLVNKKQPRIYLLNRFTDEGTYTWAETSTVNFSSRVPYNRETKYDLVKKYAGELAGVVLYDPSLSPHHRNLAGTVGGLEGAIPVTPEIYAKLKSSGIQLDVKVDLTKLEHTSAISVYEYLHQEYWQRCDKRLLVSAKPHDEKGRGDYHHTRDMAAACGAAVVWLDTLIPEEKTVLQKFFQDMKAGEGVVLGWYSTERSGITTASEFGIGTMPADHYLNGSMYSGGDHTIRIPAVPRKPKLENKAYVAIYLSDGDNIQYTQRAMRRIWDRAASIRGKTPLNWTIAPGLVDIGPGLLNYYYTTATPNDCFVAGPSGMGYLMPFNTLEDPGAPVGIYLQDQERMDGYARLTQTYLDRSGLRVVTIWDDATPMQRASYEKYGRTLYGVTVQNFKDVPGVKSDTQNNRLRFEKLAIPYAGSYEHIYRSLNRRLSRWEGQSPLFLSYQVTVWGEMKPHKIVELQEQLQKEYPGKVEFVRADHYFGLYNEANHLPFNLCLSPETTVTASDKNTDPERTRDGTPSTVWQASTRGENWLMFDLSSEHTVSRYLVRFAGPESVTRTYRVQASVDGQAWTTLDSQRESGSNVADVEVNPARAKYIRFVIDDAGGSQDGIAEIEIYGRR